MAALIDSSLKSHITAAARYSAQFARAVCGRDSAMHDSAAPLMAGTLGLQISQGGVLAGAGGGELPNARRSRRRFLARGRAVGRCSRSCRL